MFPSEILSAGSAETEMTEDAAEKREKDLMMRQCSECEKRSEENTEVVANDLE